MFTFINDLGNCIPRTNMLQIYKNLIKYHNYYRYQMHVVTNLEKLSKPFYPKSSIASY